MFLLHGHMCKDELAMPAYIKDGIAVEQTETNDLNSVIADSDVIYVTRIQKERFANEIDYEAVKNHFKITKATLEKVILNVRFLHNYVDQRQKKK